jgi:hypothetical protein
VRRANRHWEGVLHIAGWRMRSRRPVIAFVIAACWGSLLAGPWLDGHAPTPPFSARAYASPQSRDELVLSEFEGRYRVGPTTCTVKPVRMAFEVRWAKGREAMLFFFDDTDAQGRPVFVSEDRGRGTDRFIFDDNRYNAGIFVRADGKSFPVKRD